MGALQKRFWPGRKDQRQQTAATTLLQQAVLEGQQACAGSRPGSTEWRNPSSRAIGNRRRSFLSAACVLKGGSALLLAAVAAEGRGRGLASRPPMGYSTRNAMECKPSEKKVQKIADKLKKLGFNTLGYNYIILDDCWAVGRTAEGRLTPEPERFPAGISALAKSVRQLGFKFGLSTNRGPTTCAGYTASMGNEALDAQTFASWGVELMKNDGCWDPECGPQQDQFPKSGSCDAAGRQKAVDKYEKMQGFLKSADQRIVHMVGAGGGQPWFAPVGRRLGESWQVAAEVTGWDAIYEITRVMEQLSPYHGPDGWNDPGTLLGSSQGGEFQLHPLQSRAQFSLWVVMAAPLILGVEMLHISSWDTETFGNKEAIRVNQDPLGKAGQVAFTTCPPYPVLTVSENLAAFAVPQSITYDQDVLCGSHRANSCAACPHDHGEGWCHGDCRWVEATERCVPGEISSTQQPREQRPEPWTIAAFRQKDKRQCQQVWTKELVGGDVAVVAVNFAEKDATVSVPLQDLGLPEGQRACVQDLWYKGPLLNPRVISDMIKLKLKADGGHALLRLKTLRNGSTAELEAMAGRPMATEAAKRPEEVWTDEDYELSPAEDRLQRIWQRHRGWRSQSVDDVARLVVHTGHLPQLPAYEHSLPMAVWLMPLSILLALAAVASILLSRLGMFRGRARQM